MRNPCLPDFELPQNHKLFEYMRKFKYYNKNLSRLIPIITEKYKNLAMIDIGANIGDIVAILRNDGILCPTLCIEGDEEYIYYLEKNTQMHKEVEIKKVFLGDHDAVQNMSVFRDNKGTSRLGQSTLMTNVYKLDTVLNEYPKFKMAKFLKIDTDGFDNIVLRGAEEFLKTASPVIFMEYSVDDLFKQNDGGLEVFKYLASIRYQKAIMYENFGEYMFSFDINDEDFVEEMRDFFHKNERIPYADLCVFHADDVDLFKNCRRAELDFFRKEKS